MAGYALLAAADDPHPRVRALFLEGHWATARDPLHDCTIVDADDRSIPAFGPVRVALPARPEVKGR